MGICLVIGATGSLGSALVRRLADEELRVLVRDAEDFRERFPGVRADVFEGDLSRPKDIDRAIDDADVVFHCAGACYEEWGDMIGHTRRLIKAAEEEVKVVKIVFPGNVHVYGDVGPGPVTEDHPHDPGTRKGDIRMNIERRLRTADEGGECRTTIARFPDLFGPGVTNRCMRRIFPGALSGSAVTWPGDLEVEREFLYVDDAAEAMVRLAGSDVAWGQTWHFPGPGPITARQFIEKTFRLAGTEPRVRSRSRTAMRMSPKREERLEAELYYLFKRPPRMDGSKWREAFGEPRLTGYDAGIRRTLEWWRSRSGQ